jgi:hypothetical protein
LLGVRLRSCFGFIIFCEDRTSLQGKWQTIQNERRVSLKKFFTTACRNEMHVAKNAKQTSSKAATAASKVLRDGRTSAASKTAAASALAQKGTGKK